MQDHQTAKSKANKLHRIKTGQSEANILQKQTTGIHGELDGVP